MRLKEILQDRVSKKKNKTQEQQVIDWLNKKAGEIINLTAKHLDYVDHVLDEFDCHDVTHSEKVLEVIEDLLGDKAEKLSSYNLFFLIAVSYLHDCGMAVSDYETKVLKIAERYLDDKEPLSQDEAEAKIKSKRKAIYGSFNNEDIQNWLFVPAQEDTLISYFASLLRNYQKYRHGRIADIQKNNENRRTKATINKNIRTDFLRITHHERIEDYVKNWGKTRFESFPSPIMGQKLANDIAKCCRTHGENEAYLLGDQFKELTKVKYYGSETANLQFVAMMLRLGDIIHFSYDRAHPVLRALHHFSSKYSYNQWHIKANGLSFDVSNGTVSCIAHCQSPKDYYDLWTYVDYIDHELSLYNSISPKWEDFPIITISDKVDRTNLTHDTSFEPAHERKFTLNQKKVLELLMGSKLYTNEYACLRELYQNSLDACRCQIGQISTGRIEFGLKEDNGRKYVYCLDNGKGMTRNIIEKFMLNIGSSYYRSPEFFQKRAETGSHFTPTSQFGIGILSCFMIGDEIEITTKEKDNEVVSCVMEGPNEYFYYKKNQLEIEKNEELINKYGPSGTLVKVYLNKEYQRLLNDDPLEVYAYLLWYNGYDVPETENKRWFHHLYNIMNDFVLIVPEDINVLISIRGNDEPIQIYNKPLPITKELQHFAQLNNYGTDDDFYQFEQLKKDDYLDIQATDKDDIQNNNDNQDNQDNEKNLECRMIIEAERDVYGGNVRINGGGRCCVDGISISSLNDSSNSLLYRLMSMGILNFIGKNRPQLSVNRDDIINTSLNKYEQEARLLLESLIKKSIREVCLYIKNNKIPAYKPLYNEIWYRLLRKFEFFMGLFYKCLIDVDLCHDMKMPFQSINMTFGDFINANETVIPRKEMKNEVKYSVMQLLLLRLLESEKIEFRSENELVMIGHKVLPEFIPDVKRLDVYDYYFCISQYDTFWSEYDIVQFAKFRIISNKLKNRILSDDTFGKYLRSDNYIYLNKGLVKKLKTDRKKRIFRKYEPTGISQKSTLVFIDNCGLYKIGNFIYDIISDLVFYFMSKYELENSITNGKIQYSGLTLFVHNKSILLLLEMSRDQKGQKICYARRDKCTRQELLNSIPDDWKGRIKNVLFVDGSILSPES